MAVPFTDLDKKYGLPEGTLASVWQQESGCGRDWKSPAGAIGHFQFMMGTRNEIMQKTGLDPHSPDPKIAAECAGYYLRDLMSRYNGDITKALSAYNWGMGNVDNAIRNYGGAWLQHAPNETQKYAPQILARMGMGDRVNYTERRGARGNGPPTAEEAAEDEAERKIRHDILRSLGFTDKQIADLDKDGGNDLLGTMFLALVGAVLEGAAKQAQANNVVVAPQPMTNFTFDPPAPTAGIPMLNTSTMLMPSQ